MRRERGAILLVLSGLLIGHYAYLHDVIWQSHNGFIVMGLKSYGLALFGALLVIGGVIRFGTGR